MLLHDEAHIYEETDLRNTPMVHPLAVTQPHKESIFNHLCIWTLLSNAFPTTTPQGTRSNMSLK